VAMGRLHPDLALGGVQHGAAPSGGVQAVAGSVGQSGVEMEVLRVRLKALPINGDGLVEAGEVPRLVRLHSFAGPSSRCSRKRGDDFRISIFEFRPNALFVRASPYGESGARPGRAASKSSRLGTSKAFR